MPSTVALRFRDLSGPTIAEHSRIIDDVGYVWWGWWSKPEERVPRDLLAEFLDVIQRDGSLDVFLVDSGNRYLYAARLIGIEFAPASNPIPSPEPERTPTYYAGGGSYRIWFKFDGIEGIDAEAITDYSYDELPQGTFDDDPHLEDFDGKRVFSLSELLGRHRTIYFLRPSADGDPTHLVSLGASERPGPFLVAAREVPSDYILHLSDLHFGPEHAYPTQSEEPNPNLAIRVISDLRQLYGEQPPSAVILSGDFTWQGLEDEFAQAAEFIDQLQSIYKLEAWRFIVCPGNHDIQWAEGETYDPTARVTAAPREAEANYRSFVQSKLQMTFPDETLAMGRRFLLKNLSPVDIVAVNSSRLEDRHFAGFGYVSREQLQSAASEMGWDNGAGQQLRLLVLHHHVVPVLPVEEIATVDQRYSLTLDAAELLYTALELGVDFIVHGHMHQPLAGTYSRVVRNDEIPRDRRLAIQAVGSAGVKAAHIPPGIGRNSYCTYEISAERVRVRVRAASEDIRGFSGYWSYELKRAGIGKGLVP